MQNNHLSELLSSKVVKRFSALPGFLNFLKVFDDFKFLAKAKEKKSAALQLLIYDNILSFEIYFENIEQNSIFIVYFQKYTKSADSDLYFFH